MSRPTTTHFAMDWVDALPDRWTATPLRFLLSEPITDGPHTTPEFLVEGVPFLSVDGIQNGELVFTNCRYVSQEAHAEYSRKARPRAGDILMGKAASTGKIARVKVATQFSIWSPLALLRIDESAVSCAFVEYALKSDWLQAQIDVLCTSNTQKNISMEDIPTLLFPVPPLDVQHCIVGLLDRNTAAIDALIAKKERLIELLQEKRQALITQAVTKGLDPNVPMKESGVALLGAVPRTWRVCRLKHTMSRIADCPHETPEVSRDFEFPAVRTSDVDRGRLYLDDAQRVSLETYKRRTERLTPAAGDILYSREGGRFGHAAVIPPNTRLCLGQRMMIFRPSPKHSSPYLMWLLNAHCVFQQVKQDTLGAAAPRVNIPTISNAWIPCPTLVEQQAIAGYIDRELVQMDALEGQIARSLGLLREYRQSLITAAVTGKIDLRSSAGPDLQGTLGAAKVLEAG